MPAEPQAVRRVLVTGANRGLGLGFVDHYLRAGCAVTATCRHPDHAAILQEKARVIACDRLKVEPLDVADEASRVAFGTRITAQGVWFDLVINNAGISVDEPFGAWSPEVLERTLRVNTVGPALLAQLVAPQMVRGSVLVQLSSGLGSLALNLNPAAPLDAYAMSKAALNILTRRLAAKLAAREITVVALSPGWVRTDMGGSAAPVGIDQAVASMTATIERLSLADSGTFISAEGGILPW